MTEHEHSDVTSVQKIESVGSIDELEAAFPRVADLEAARPDCSDAVDGHKERA